MPRPAPLLDERTFRDLVEEAFRQAAVAFKNAPAGLGVWKPPKAGWTRAALENPDAGTVLAALFARMMEIALQRLNRVPEKNLLAFLNQMGVSLLPPAPARVPITLVPAQGAGSAFVRRGLQVASSDGVTFETERDVTLTAAQMVEAWSIDPVWDRYAGRTAEVTQQASGAWSPFEGSQPVPHVLYFAHSDLLNFTQATRLLLRFPQVGSGLSETEAGFLTRAVRWWYWHEGQPRLLRTTAEAKEIEIATGVLRKMITVSFEDEELASQRHKSRAGTVGAVAAYRPPTTTMTWATAGRPTTGTTDGIAGEILSTAGSSTFELGTETFEGVELLFGVKLSPTKLTLQELSDYSFVPPPLPKTERFRVLAVDLGQVGGPGLPRPLSTRWIAAELIEPLPGNRLADALRMKSVEMQVASDQVRPDHIFVNDTEVEPGKHFQPFGSRPVAGDTLCLGSEEAFGKAGAKVDISFGYRPALRWQYWNGKVWKDLELQGDASGDARNFTRSGTVVFKRPADMKNHSASVADVPEKDKAWLRVDLFAPEGEKGGNYLRPPAIAVSALYPTSEAKLFTFWGWEIPHKYEFHMPLEVTAYVNEEKVDDPSQPFYPLGPQPGPKVYLHVGLTLPSDEATLSQVKQVILSIGSPTPTARLIWEYGTTDGWVPMGFVDNTDELTHGGTVQFVCPATGIPRKSVNGRVSRWVRARLIAGDYGRDAEYIPVQPADTTKGFKVRIGTGRVNPPTIYSMWMKYDVTDAIRVVRQTGAIFDLPLSSEVEAFRAFLPASAAELGALADEHPALYLGFDTPFGNVPVTFYVATAAREYVGGALRQRPPRLIDERQVPTLVTPSAPTGWQYWNGLVWKDLIVADETAGFTESGQITFVAPMDWAKLARFDSAEAFWLRVQWPGRADDLPSINAISLNTVPAIQAVTVRDEVVGSSNGRPSQVFKLLRPPVLPRQQIWVREPEVPSEEERAAIEDEEGLDAVQIRIDPVTEIPEAWVRWHEVATLDASGPRDRHYTIDHTTGEFAFGDGARGLVPPRGVDNIRAREYRSGGGSAGNLPVGAIKKAVNPPPTIDKASNPQPSDGGADLETITAVQERGPYSLKHRDRAVSPEDYEWLARQASGTRVARARCLRTVNRQLQQEAGWITVLVVPQGSGSRTLPSAELIREVENYLEARAFGSLTGLQPERINVIGPAYLRVAVQATIVPTDMAAAEQVRQRALAALESFFHPLTGGPNGTGWAFGRNVYASEVAALLEGVDGVHHVKALDLVPNTLVDRLNLAANMIPVEPVGEGGLVLTDDGSTSVLLAEPLPAQSTQFVLVKGFKEGDRITLALDLEVRARTTDDSDEELPIEPMTSPIAFPQNSLVMSADGRTLTRLAAPLVAGHEVHSLRLAEMSGFEIRERFTIFYPFSTSVRSVARAGVARVLLVDSWLLDGAIKAESPVRVTTLDNSVRSPLAADVGPGPVTEITLQAVATGDKVRAAHLDRTPATSSSIKVDSVVPRTDLVYVEENYLVYSGTHQISIVGEVNLGRA